MKSAHSDYFNHDEDAPGYDQDVTNDTDPIRMGYSEALSWLGSQVRPGSTVLDLGSGTGNTIVALPDSCRVVAVDVSSKMTAIAREKLKARNVTFIISDMLEFFDDQRFATFDFVVSSYAVHHLTDSEKDHLFSCVRAAIPPVGKAIFVDLMYRNFAERHRLIHLYGETHPDVVEGFHEEFFWNLDLATQHLKRHGLLSTLKQFSELTWGLVAAHSKGSAAEATTTK